MTKIYMETVSAPTNIACIKYWGKASVALNTPLNDSVSVTLDQSELRAVTTAAASLSFTRDRLWLNGIEEDTNPRFRTCLKALRRLASNNNNDEDVDWKTMHVHISSYNTFPTAAGLASSAAGYAALVASVAKLFRVKETYPGELTAIARQGSGSACRSLYGGFVAWRSSDDDKKSIAEQIEDEHHWTELRAIVFVVSDVKKDTSSTVGMNTSVATSTLLQYRAKHVVPQRMQDIITAWKARDFERFGEITMKDSNQFHAMCLDTYPPIHYMNQISQTIVTLVHLYNEWAGKIQAAYTFDAGPNAVLFVLETHAVEIGALLVTFLYPHDKKQQQSFMTNDEFARKVNEFRLNDGLVAMVHKKLGDKVPVLTAGDDNGKKMYYVKVGSGPKSLGMDEAIIDPTTGLNTYNP